MIDNDSISSLTAVLGGTFWIWIFVEKLFAVEYHKNKIKWTQKPQKQLKGNGACSLLSIHCNHFWRLGCFTGTWYFYTFIIIQKNRLFFGLLHTTKRIKLFKRLLLFSQIRYIMFCLFCCVRCSCLSLDLTYVHTNKIIWELRILSPFPLSKERKLETCGGQEVKGNSKNFRNHDLVLFKLFVT